MFSLGSHSCCPLQTKIKEDSNKEEKDENKEDEYQHDSSDEEVG